MNPSLLVAILEAIIADTPELIQTVKDWVSSFSGSPADTTPLGPKVSKDTEALDQELKAL